MKLKKGYLDKVFPVSNSLLQQLYGFYAKRWNQLSASWNKHRKLQFFYTVTVGSSLLLAASCWITVQIGHPTGNMPVIKLYQSNSVLHTDTNAIRRYQRLLQVRDSLNQIKNK